MPARGLYLITPDELDTARLLARVVPVLDAGVACLQYRNKVADTGAFAAGFAAPNAWGRHKQQASTKTAPLFFQFPSTTIPPFIPSQLEFIKASLWAAAP